MGKARPGRHRPGRALFWPWVRFGRHLRRLCAAAVAVGLPLTALGQPADIGGWQGTRWNMTAVALASTFGGVLQRLPSRWIYHEAYAEQALLDVDLYGQEFRVFFQMNANTDLLQQVLLEARPPRATPAAYLDVIAALRETHGAPARTCVVPKPGGEPLVAELTWQFPTTTIHASFLDFNTTAVLFQDSRRDIDPLQPYIERRRIVRRFLPRRITIRLHASDREDLLPRLACEPAN